ncbi:MAG: restriction endonuclease subunit S [Bacteroidales bacterium]|nr:restriction endonuclease subunit S [Bacteroidales bacterium]
MKQIKDFKWNAVLLSELFYFDKGNQNNMGTMQDGNIPLVSAKKCDNGYKAFISENGKRLYEGHCITLNNDGDGGAGLAYYQPTKMALDSHVTALIPKVPMSKHTMLFIARSISMQRSLFGHGRSINSARLRIFRLMMPMNENNQPDYAFMEEYMKSVEERLLMQYKNHLVEPMPNVDVGKGSVDTRWKAFLMDEIFVIEATKSGIDRKKLNGTVGDIPYLTRTDKNNAWDSFIGEQPNYEKDKGNVLSVGLDTQTAFYQPIPFYTGQNIQVFSHKQMNKYVAMFVIPLLKRQMQKFNWGGNGATLSRLRRQRIMLPELDGQPDFDYMEKYMRKQEALLLNRYDKAKIRSQY